MVVQSGKTSPHKIGPRSNPGLLDVFSMDPQRNPGTNKKTLLHISFIRKHGLCVGGAVLFLTETRFF